EDLLRGGRSGEQRARSGRCVAIRCDLSGFRRQDPHGLAVREIPPEETRRSEILEEIEPALPLLFIEEPPVPVRAVFVGAVRQCHDARQAWIRSPRDERFPDIRAEAKGRILMMARMVVPARAHGPAGGSDAV